MSDHFKHSLRVIAAVCIALIAAFIWLQHKALQVVGFPPNPHRASLAADDRAVVAFNEKTHRVTVVTSSGTLRMYARNPTVHIKKSGMVVVDRHLFGFQSQPYVGFGYSDTSRALVGYSPAYWGAFDASVALGVALDNRGIFAKPYVAVGYNCWSNLSLDVGANPAGIKQLDVIIFMSLKL